MSNPKRAIDRMVKFHRQWVAETGEEVRSYAIDRINAGLTEGSIRSLRNISSNLKSLGMYWGTHGDLSLVDGNPAGWQQVHRSGLLYLWVLRIELLLFRKLGDSPSLTQFPPLASCALCYAMTMELDDWRRELANLLFEMSSEPRMVRREYWQERQFEPFVLHLHGIMENKGQHAYSSGGDLGVYADVFADWNDDARLAQALVQICDYHCKNMDDTGDWDPEFDHPPFDLIPWELLAIGRIRQLAGLVMPAISHPLAKPMMMQFEKIAQIQDETLTRVETFYRQVVAP